MRAGDVHGQTVVVFRVEAAAKTISLFGKKTNNEAEYEPVISALSWLLANRDKLNNNIFFNLDSELVARQLSGTYRIKSPNLKELATKANNLEKRLEKNVKYISVRRDKNKLADALVNKKLDENML